MSDRESWRIKKSLLPAESKISNYQFNLYKAVTDFNSSGIGRSVAILMAREGADITIVHLPEEQVDADDTKRQIEAEKRACLLFSGDLARRETCYKAVEAHVQKYVGVGDKPLFLILTEK